MIIPNTRAFLQAALEEDIRDGDHSTLACIPATEQGKAVLKIKEDGVIAGLDIAREIIHLLEPEARFTMFKQDGDRVSYGEKAFELDAKVHTILQGERLLLNIMQRMSGIASLTAQYVDKIKHTECRLLDTRKTTPNFRWFEKRAVVLGGGHNHRMGLYDMVMLKDNHIDYCGGLEKAIDQTRAYLSSNQLNLPIEVETRNLSEVERVVKHGGVDRIMFDNFSPADIRTGVGIVNKQMETEASGGINLDTIVAYAETGVDFVSCGAIIHHAVSMDLSLKAVR
jgi:nicotinate-nucleotide pyrophosphorylase (carboxylating)